MTDCEIWRIEVRDLAAPLRPVRIEWQVERHFWIVMLMSIVRLESCKLGEMRREVLAAVTVIILVRRLD